MRRRLDSHRVFTVLFVSVFLSDHHTNGLTLLAFVALEYRKIQPPFGGFNGSFVASLISGVNRPSEVAKRHASESSETEAHLGVWSPGMGVCARAKDLAHFLLPCLLMHGSNRDVKELAGDGA